MRKQTDKPAQEATSTPADNGDGAKPAPSVTRKHSWGEAKFPRNPMQHPMCHTVEERVEHIMGLMLRGKWYRHRSKLELADRWGVQPDTIQSYSVEASRAVDKTLKESRAEVASLAVHTLARIARAKSKMPGDRAAAKGAADSLLRFSGYDQPEEDKSRESTVRIVQEGQVATSPAMQGLVAGLMARPRGAKDGAAPETGVVVADEPVSPDAKFGQGEA